MAHRYIDILKEKFGDAVVLTHAHRGDETAVVARGVWADACRFLKEGHGFDMMVDLCGADYPSRKERFEVVVHLRRMQDGARLRLKSRLDSSEPRVETLTGIYPAANWFEREAFDLFGIRFDGHPNMKRLLTHPSFEGCPLRKDYPIDRRCPIPVPDTLMDEMLPNGSNSDPRSTINDKRATIHDSRMYLNLGPSHPAMHGCFRVLCELDGERIRKAVPEIGYLHRCFEKEAENHAWHTVIPYTDRLNYCSPMMNNVGYCMAVEKLLGLEIPERAKWIRMLVCEVSRVWDHLVANGANLVDIGALTNFWYLFNARELFTDWIEALTGARLTTNYARIGGVAR